MIDHEPVLSVHYIRQIAEQMRSLGADVGHWLKLSGLTETQLNDSSFTFGFSVFRQLVLDALALTREPALGLFVGERW